MAKSADEEFCDPSPPSKPRLAFCQKTEYVVYVKITETMDALEGYGMEITHAYGRGGTYNGVHTCFRPLFGTKGV